MAWFRLALEAGQIATTMHAANQEPKLVSTGEPEWQREVVRLAQRRIPFVLVGFRYVLDIAFCNALKERHNFQVTIDSETSRAHFKPKYSGERPPVAGDEV